MLKLVVKMEEHTRNTRINQFVRALQLEDLVVHLN